MTHRRLLLVDDAREWAQDFAALLEGIAETRIAHDQDGAIAEARHGVFDAVLLDLRFHGEDLGLIILEQLREHDPALPVVLLTSHDSARVAVSALRRGAFDYLVKGVPFEEVEATLQRAFEHRDMKLEMQRIRQRLDEAAGADWVGRSEASRRLLADAAQVAAKDTVVLILGETGTGKGTLARAIHRWSGRPGLEVVFHGSSGRRSSEEMVEAELFGVLRGAFTGCDRDRDGLVRTAARGTLVLDDIEEIPPGTQAKLLQLLEEKTYRPLGGTRSFPSEVRIVATAKPDLAVRVKDGRFREDLFYRIRVYPIEIPPLRERPEDALALAVYYLDRFSRENRVEIDGFSPDARSWLMSHPWPGNVRELKNSVEAAVLRCRGRILDVLDFPGRIARETPAGTADLSKDAMLRGHVERLMREAGGNVTKAARLAGMTRSGFQRLRKRVGLSDADDPRAGSDP